VGAGLPADRANRRVIAIRHAEWAGEKLYANAHVSAPSSNGRVQPLAERQRSESAATHC